MCQCASVPPCACPHLRSSHVLAAPASERAVGPFWGGEVQWQVQQETLPKSKRVVPPERLELRGRGGAEAGAEVGGCRMLGCWDAGGTADAGETTGAGPGCVAPEWGVGNWGLRVVLLGCCIPRPCVRQHSTVLGRRQKKPDESADRWYWRVGELQGTT